MSNEPGLVPELVVTDYEASRRFWCDLVGFSLRYERPEEGFGYLVLGNAHLMLDQIDQGRTWATLGRALLIPVAWVAYTLVRGSFTHQYPYGFVNVWRIGYAQVAINIVVILIGALLFMALFAGADWLIRKAYRRS